LMNCEHTASMFKEPLMEFEKRVASPMPWHICQHTAIPKCAAFMLDVTF
jgi:hypothetical protein